LYIGFNPIYGVFMPDIWPDLEFFEHASVAQGVRLNTFKV
jgi:hypothetical protein